MFKATSVFGSTGGDTCSLDIKSEFEGCDESDLKSTPSSISVPATSSSGLSPRGGSSICSSGLPTAASSLLDDEDDDEDDDDKGDDDKCANTVSSVLQAVRAVLVSLIVSVVNTRSSEEACNSTVGCAVTVVLADRDP